MLARLREGLLAVGALPETHTDGYFREWRALFIRADLTPKEVRLLEHLGRKLGRRAGSPRAGTTTDADARDRADAGVLDEE
jgi:tRNA C32,U32 (ribose-2'-O)-methylase TrmJ